MSNFIKLVRPVNFIITFISVFIAAYIASESLVSNVIVLIAALAASFTAAAGNVINDYYDIEIDKIAHPDRPLASGKLSLKGALRFYIILNLMALSLSAFLGIIAFGFVFFTIVLLFLYSLFLKRIILFSNYVIAWLAGMVFIFGGIIVGNVTGAVIPALFAFLINFIREIIKDLQDLRGDLSAGVITYPAKYGTGKARRIVLALTVILILLTLHPFIYNYYMIEYFVLVMIIVNPLLIYFLRSIFNDDSEKNMERMSRLLKLIMVFGLAAIYIGK